MKKLSTFRKSKRASKVFLGSERQVTRCLDTDLGLGSEECSDKVLICTEN
jgi:hypothetical protein